MGLEEFKEGKVLLIDKPLEWTSFQVVNKVRWHLRKTFNIKKIKVGHAGTLDPLATGLLIICTGKFTKKIETYQGQKKTYTGEMTLGATTPSYDMETAVDQTFPTAHLTEEMIKKATHKFLGEIDQKPPIFSAIQQDGKRLYELARAGKTTEIKTRKVTVEQFNITQVDLPKVRFEVICSKGTYIRSLVHDFGKTMDSGAYLSSLRRTAIGSFKVADAQGLSEFIESVTN